MLWVGVGVGSVRCGLASRPKGHPTPVIRSSVIASPSVAQCAETRKQNEIRSVHCTCRPYRVHRRAESTQKMIRPVPDEPPWSKSPLSLLAPRTSGRRDLGTSRVARYDTIAGVRLALRPNTPVNLRPGARPLHQALIKRHKCVVTRRSIRIRKRWPMRHVAGSLHSCGVHCIPTLPPLAAPAKHMS